MEIEWILAYLILGIAVGFFAGLFGIGGGGIMVPVLTTLFVKHDFPFEHSVHMALATSMAAIIVTAISSLKTHNAHQAVLWPVVWKITPGILAGTFGAAFIASNLPPAPLAIFFTCFMAYVSVRMVMNGKPKPNRQLPGFPGLAAAGTGIGGISALVAIGGGSLTVPFLTWCNVRIQKAIGTSAAVGLPIAIAGSAGYAISGLGAQGLPAYTVGYVYLPAAVLISIASWLTAPLGAKLAHKLPVGILKKLFALLLMMLAARMLFTVL